MSTCRTCTYWNPNPGQVTQGRCELAESRSGLGDPDSLAVALDYESYSAYLETDASFGCNQWGRKDSGLLYATFYSLNDVLTWELQTGQTILQAMNDAAWSEYQDAVGREQWDKDMEDDLVQAKINVNTAGGRVDEQGFTVTIVKESK